MNDRNETAALKPELDEDDRTLIQAVFEETVAPKLRRHHARIGSLGCGFAGAAYENWMLHFRSAGDDFEILELEYDEEGGGLDLDL